ncbi:uncharacterized protein LOC122389131 [Amphibalanus amphitrite]|uniref:uncharacterized protein LOC122389131 n=1 Tax=Amphibalanus amphitrite TaxID=1232801 RepID=UPI001C91AA5A|nr:uncharacterized protein LOC122389131 [Amphibalanus amphitrite]
MACYRPKATNPVPFYPCRNLPPCPFKMTRLTPSDPAVPSPLRTRTGLGQSAGGLGLGCAAAGTPGRPTRPLLEFACGAGSTSIPSHPAPSHWTTVVTTMRLEEWFFQLTQRADAEALVNQHVSVAGAWDLGALLPAASLLALLLACCCLLPGLRRRRLHSAIAVIWSAGTGCSLACVYCNPSWAAVGGRATTALSYSSSTGPVDWVLAVRFGLHGADLRLDSPTGQFHYRDQLEWPLTPRGMTELYRGALRRGLAVPLVTALEVLSKDAGPCTYGRHFRRAGYVTSWLVGGLLAAWLVGTLLLGSVPHLAAKTMCWTGVLAAATAGTYALLMPSHEMQLRFDGVLMRVHLSWCFWLLLAVGALNIALGGWMLYKESRSPGYFSTVFEVDFDMPVYRYGWPTAPKPARPLPALRRNDLRLNIDFVMNDLSGGATPTPTEERFATPSYTAEATQPFWTPGSIPRRPPPPESPPVCGDSRRNWLYPTLEATPAPSAPPLPPTFATENTCKRRTPRKTAAGRSRSAERSVALPLEEEFAHTR